MCLFRKPGPQLRAQQNTCGQQEGAANALRKRAGRDMSQRSRQRHVGQHELGGIPMVRSPSKLAQAVSWNYSDTDVGILIIL